MAWQGSDIETEFWNPNSCEDSPDYHVWSIGVDEDGAETSERVNVLIMAK